MHNSVRKSTFPDYCINATTIDNTRIQGFLQFTDTYMSLTDTSSDLIAQFKLETEDWRLETGDRRLETGDRKKGIKKTCRCDFLYINLNFREETASSFKSQVKSID